MCAPEAFTPLAMAGGATRGRPSGTQVALCPLSLTVAQWVPVSWHPSCGECWACPNIHPNGA